MPLDTLTIATSLRCSTLISQLRRSPRARGATGCRRRSQEQLQEEELDGSGDVFAVFIFDAARREEEVPLSQSPLSQVPSPQSPVPSPQSQVPSPKLHPALHITTTTVTIITATRPRRLNTTLEKQPRFGLAVIHVSAGGIPNMLESRFLFVRFVLFSGCLIQ